jgi:hypothetical protein
MQSLIVTDGVLVDRAPLHPALSVFESRVSVHPDPLHLTAEERKVLKSEDEAAVLLAKMAANERMQDDVCATDHVFYCDGSAIPRKAGAGAVVYFLADEEVFVKSNRAGRGVCSFSAETVGMEAQNHSFCRVAGMVLLVSVHLRPLSSSRL